jgi:hypothetical protein
MPIITPLGFLEERDDNYLINKKNKNKNFLIYMAYFYIGMCFIKN